MAPPGVELILGTRRDPLFGPLVMVGLGGVTAELFEDVAIRLAPIDEDEAEAMLRTLKRSEEHTSELQSLMRISYAVFCLKKKTKEQINKTTSILHIQNRQQHTRRH